MFDEIFEEIKRIDIREDKVILVTISIIWLKKKNVGYIKLKVSWLEYEYTFFSKKQCKIEDTYWKVLWFYELFLHYFYCKVNICNLQAIWENPFVKLKIVFYCDLNPSNFESGKESILIGIRTPETLYLLKYI